MKGNVFISGAGRGLGRQLLRVFAAEGYMVYGLLRDEAQLSSLEPALTAWVKPVITDVTSEDCGEKIRAVIKNEPLHLLINNAGIGGRCPTLKNLKAADMLKLFDTHCVGAMRVCQALIGNLLASDEPSVIHINSRMGSVTEQYKGSFDKLTMNYEYRIAKAAQNMFSACLKHEYGHRLKVFQVHPGRLRTALSQADADLDPAHAAGLIFSAWHKGKLKEAAGINDTQENRLYAW